jgi:Cu(I)/Ag(I) efflux system membrane fusion protein
MMRALLGLAAAATLLSACGEQTAPHASLETARETESSSEHAAIYSCGMHPQVVQEGPGTCPICEMDLTLASPSSGSAPSEASGRTSRERKIRYWVAPMDPTYVSDKPGKSPMGMDLVPVYEDPETTPSAGAVVSIDPGIVQNMGARTEPARRQTVFRHVRSIGEIEVGEDRISVVNLRFSGWVERIYADKTGDPVEKGQILFEIYSPELLAAQREYLLARRTQGPQSALARSARRKLELWNLAEGDLQQIATSGEVSRTLAIRSPRSGFVLHKNILEGARVNAGEDLYRIGDLRQIWVTAEVYEFDAPWVEVGQKAQMELAYEGGKVLQGKVAYIYPTLNEVSRTLRVRLEFENPSLLLKPGMFATVYIQFRRVEDVLAIPTEAILDSGRRKIVFVAVSDGHFEPREIATGLIGDHHITEIVSGLEEGDEVVVSGQFLIDSESQLQEAIRKMLARRSSREDAAGEPPAESVYSCPMHPEVVAHDPGHCPICGMELETQTSEHGETP